MDKITSKDNKLIKSVKKLIDDKKYRQETNCFVAETSRVVDTLLKGGLKHRNILVLEGSKFANDYLNYENVSIVKDFVFESIDSISNNDGVIAVFYKQKNDFSYQSDKKYVVLDKLQNPGNFGTIIRTCLAFGVDGVVVTNDTVDLYNTATIRSSMGGSCLFPIKISTNLLQAINEMKQSKIKVFATALNKFAKPLDTITFSAGSAVVFGNEGNGLKDSDIKSCDETIYIPIKDKIDSLNVGIAAGIIIYNLCK
jgi:TrmH family RNA methyltransferase